MLSIRHLAAKRQCMNVQTIPISTPSRSRRNSLTVPSFRTLPDNDIDIELSDQSPLTPSSITDVPGRSIQTLEKDSEERGQYTSWSHPLSRKVDGPHLARIRRNEDVESGHALGEESSREKEGPFVGRSSDVEGSWENVQKSEVEENIDLVAQSDKKNGSCICPLGPWIQDFGAV